MRIIALLLVLSAFGFAQESEMTAEAASADKYNYRLLATTKTSTMQREMNEAAEAGYRFGGVSGGVTAFGGEETVVIMKRDRDASMDRFKYKLLATNKTSTMQKELQEAGDEGFEYKGQAVFQTAAGGNEVVVILEMDREVKRRPRYKYLLLATQKTSTMQKELKEAGNEGYEFVGVTVGETAFGGHEVVSILRKAE